MSAGRNWRGHDPFVPFGGFLWLCAVILTWPFRHPHKTVKALEPWGIVGLFLAVAAFWHGYTDRIEERTVRAWQLLTTEAPGNSGKREALHYLNSADRWCIFGACKKQVPLVGIDLSTDEGEMGAYLNGANLIWTNLEDARNLSQAQLDGACGDENTKLDGDLAIPMCSDVDWFERVHGERSTTPQPRP